MSRMLEVEEVEIDAESMTQREIDQLRNIMRFKKGRMK
mgnify:CR=1 FL=1